MEMSLFTFERLWERGHYWAMLALPVDQLPATAEVPVIARSVAALEALHPEAARTAYTTALKRWPQQASLWFGLGNTAYALNDFAGAAAAYQQAVDQQADFADAWNNLAQAELDMGQRASAGAAIARAVELGGVRLPQYLELQARIQANKADETAGQRPN
jgi:tetratricopeptide (TPR) repeat protein